MIAGRGEEPDAVFLQAAAQGFGRQVQRHAQRREHVGAAAARSDGAVAVLDDRRAARRQDEARRRGHVEEIELVAARAAHVQRRAGQPRGVDAGVHGAGEQGLHEPGDLGGRLAFGAEGAEKGGLGGVGLALVDQGGHGVVDLHGATGLRRARGFSSSGANVSRASGGNGMRDSHCSSPRNFC